MPDRRLKTAYNAWTEAIENMKAALAANPLVSDALMASAQVFEDVGRMIFGSTGQSKKRGARRTKSRAARKSTAVSARKGKKLSGRAGRRTRSSKKA